MRLIYHPDAEAELIEAAQFYEQRLSNLGGQFLETIENAVREIQNSPRQWRVIERDVRLCLITRFPFGIYFRIELDELRILSIKHHSRHSDMWRERLEE